MKKIYVVGNKTSKSLSPLIFNHWFKKYKINARYAFVEVTSGINFLLNMPKFQEIMQSAGAKVQVDSLNCATCGESVLPANAMIYFAAANMEDMGEAMDIFASNEIQRWVFANIAPHINITDGGVLAFHN